MLSPGFHHVKTIQKFSSREYISDDTFDEESSDTLNDKPYGKYSENVPVLPHKRIQNYDFSYNNDNPNGVPGSHPNLPALSTGIQKCMVSGESSIYEQDHVSLYHPSTSTTFARNNDAIIRSSREKYEMKYSKCDNSKATSAQYDPVRLDYHELEIILYKYSLLSTQDLVNWKNNVQQKRAEEQVANACSYLPNDNITNGIKSLTQFKESSFITDRCLRYIEKNYASILNLINVKGHHVWQYFKLECNIHHYSSYSVFAIRKRESDVYDHWTKQFLQTRGQRESSLGTDCANFNPLTNNENPQIKKIRLSKHEILRQLTDSRAKYLFVVDFEIPRTFCVLCGLITTTRLANIIPNLVAVPACIMCLVMLNKPGIDENVLVSRINEKVKKPIFFKLSGDNRQFIPLESLNIEKCLISYNYIERYNKRHKKEKNKEKTEQCNKKNEKRWNNNDI